MRIMATIITAICCVVKSLPISNYAALLSQLPAVPRSVFAIDCHIDGTRASRGGGGAAARVPKSQCIVNNRKSTKQIANACNVLLTADFIDMIIIIG